MGRIINHGTFIDTYNYAELIRLQSIGDNSYRVVKSRPSRYISANHKKSNLNRKILKK